MSRTKVQNNFYSAICETMKDGMRSQFGISFSQFPPDTSVHLTIIDYNIMFGKDKYFQLEVDLIKKQIIDHMPEGKSLHALHPEMYKVVRKAFKNTLDKLQPKDVDIEVVE